MTFAHGDIVSSRITSRLARVVRILPSERMAVYMLTSGAFIPSTASSKWNLAEPAETAAPAELSLGTGATVLDTQLIDVIRRQALTIGETTAALGQIQWLARNYVVNNHKATEHELRRVLRDIDQTTIIVRLREDLRFTLKGSYEDARHNPFPPSHTATDDTTTQEG